MLWAITQACDGLGRREGQHPVAQDTGAAPHHTQRTKRDELTNGEAGADDVGPG
jgi:hypothetical protein